MKEKMNSKVVYTLPNSEFILYKAKIKLFVKIFQMLDSDNDGIINGRTIKVNSIIMQIYHYK